MKPPNRWTIGKGWVGEPMGMKEKFLGELNRIILIRILRFL